MALLARQAITSFGNGIGFLYFRDENGDFSVEPNNLLGVRRARNEAIQNIPLGQNIAAFARIKITAVSGTGDVSEINVGVPALPINQIGANVIHTGLTPTQLATALTTAINSFDPGAPNYTATSSGDTITLYAPVSEGASANNHIITIVITGGTVTTTIENPSGGASVGADTAGDDILLDADFGAAPATSTTIGAAAVTVNSVIIPKTLNGGAEINIETIAVGVIDFERKANVTLVGILNEGAAATDDLTDIKTEGFADGDVLWLFRSILGQNPTVKTTGNINLEGSVDFLMDTDTKSIMLRFDATDNDWNEITRSAVTTVNDAILRAGLVSTGKSGSSKFIIPAGGGTSTATVATTAKNIFIDGNGVTLSSSYSLVFGGSPIDGEPFLVFYDPVGDVNGNTVTLFGQLLTEDQAEGGAVVMTFWNNADSVWRTKLIVDGGFQFVENAKIPNNEINPIKLITQAGVVAGSFTLANVTVNDQGIITAISNGTVAGGTPLSRAIWVDEGGNDSTGAKGDIGLPFLTITTALTAALAGDLIILTPGTYNADRDIFKDQVNIHFMNGAKVIYTGASGAVIKDTGAAQLRVKVSGYPHIEHAGTGADKHAILLSGTGAHEIEFNKAEFTGSVTEKLFIINNANAEVRFKDCLFRQASNVAIGDLTDFSKLSMENCWFVNENGGGSADGINLGADSPVFDNVRFFITNTARFCLVASSARTIKQYDNIYSNVSESGTVTNLVPGSSLVVDSNVEFYN